MMKCFESFYIISPESEVENFTFSGVQILGESFISSQKNGLFLAGDFFWIIFGESMFQDHLPKFQFYTIFCQVTK